MPHQRLGHYRLLEVIGTGATGVVHRAYDTRLQRDVAIKVLTSPLLADEEARRRFRREALTLSSTNHPNVAAIYDFDTDQGVDFLVMEFVAGESLAETLKRGPLPAASAAALGLQLAEALEAAHRERIIHRDIKPGNLRRTADGRLKVLDFGLARRLMAGDDTTRAMTETLYGAGTLPYMSPEQVRGQAPDARSDIYSAGAVLYEMVTGRRPFPQRDPVALMHAIVHEAVLPPGALGSDVPSALEAVILRALEKDPDRRYQSAADMAIDLRRIVSPSQPAGPTAVRPARGAGSLRWVAGGGVVVALVALPALLFNAGDWRTPPIDQAPARATARPSKIAMLPVRDLAHGDAAPWNEVIATLFSGELTGARQFGFVDPQSLSSLLGRMNPTKNAAGTREVLAAQGIGLAFEPIVLKTSDGFELRATVLDPQSGESTFSAAAAFTDEEALAATVRTIAARLLAYFDLQQGGLGDQDVRAWIALRDQNIEAVKAFAQANQAIFTFQQGAEKHLLRAIAIDPGFIAPRLWLISGLLGRGEIEAARAHYAHLQTLEGDANPFEQAMIAHAGASIEGDTAMQARHLELALRYSPGNHILIINLAGARAALGEYDDALRLMRPLVESRWPYPPLYPIWGASAIRAGRLEDAQWGLMKALDTPAVDPNALALLEALALARGDRSEADRRRAGLDARRREFPGWRPSPSLLDLYDILAARHTAGGSPEAAGGLAARAGELRQEAARSP